MRIKEIAIKNYRQYKDAILTFPATSKYNLNYILAENGIGKTTLLNSITWCLYDKELHITEGLKDKTLPLLTLQTLREMEPSEESATSVSITLEDIDCDVTFERSVTFRKQEDGTAYEKSNAQKVIIAYKDKEPDVFDDAEHFEVEVNKRLPFAIQQFFFFDGEQLDTYIATNTGQDIEQTVLDMSQIGLLVSMERYLHNIHNELRQDVSKAGSAELKEINKKYEIKQKEYDEKDAFLTEKKAALRKSEQRARDINDELGNEPDVAELEEKREELFKKREDAETELATTNQDIKEFLKKSLILLNALPRIRKMYELIKEKEEKKELPPKYDKEELEAMIDGNHCFVCDRDLDTDAKLHLLGLIKRYELGQETGKLLNRIYGILDGQIREASQYEKNRDKLFGLQEKIKTELNELDAEIDAIEAKVAKVTDKERIRKLYAERDALEKAINDERMNVARREVELEQLKDEVDKLEHALEAAMAKEKKHKELTKQMALAGKAEKKVQEIIGNIKDNIKKQISDEMSDKFFGLMWKNKFTNVEITDDYTASVINEDGLECLGSCSAAERELLALAFTLALHKESGFDGPLVIDTPISRISGKLRVNFAEVLKEVSKEKQIILFVTEDEYSTNVRDVFESCANRKYKFELIDEEYVKVGEM